MSNMSNLAQIEARMVRYGELQDASRRIEEEKDLIKTSLARLMEEEHMTEHRVRYDDGTDIKATAGETVKKKFDHDQMAEDLNISVSATRDKAVIVKLVEDRALSSEQFARYFYRETEDSVSLRKVQPL